MIELGDHDWRGIYLAVHGLLAAMSTGHIADLIAPRPQLVCIGEDDPLTPSPSWQRAPAEAADTYATTCGTFDCVTLLTEPGVKHKETGQMREASFAFFETWLRP